MDLQDFKKYALGFYEFRRKANEKFNNPLRGQNGIWLKFVAWSFITKLFIEIPPCVQKI